MPQCVYTLKAEDAPKCDNVRVSDDLVRHQFRRARVYPCMDVHRHSVRATSDLLDLHAVLAP